MIETVTMRAPRLIFVEGIIGAGTWRTAVANVLEADTVAVFDGNLFHGSMTDLRHRRARSTQTVQTSTASGVRDREQRTRRATIHRTADGRENEMADRPSWSLGALTLRNGGASLHVSVNQDVPFVTIRPKSAK